MTDWEVKLFNISVPLDYKRVVVNTDNIQEAFSLAEAITPGFSAVSARFVVNGDSQ